MTTLREKLEKMRQGCMSGQCPECGTRDDELRAIIDVAMAAEDFTRRLDQSRMLGDPTMAVETTLALARLEKTL